MILVGLLTGSAFEQVGATGLEEAVNRPTAGRASSEELDTDPIAAALQSLTLEERIAQLMFVTLGGLYRPNNDDRLVLRDYAPGGVVIPKVATPLDAVKYIAELRALPIEQEKRIPLLIGTDIYSLTQHEMLPDKAFVQLPSMLAIAAAGDPESTSRLGGLIARHLNVMGFNMLLGPSLELASELPDAKGTIHNFGSDPRFAARAGTAIFTALSESRIFAVPMGFPGGGANRTKKGPAVLLTPRQQLAEQELLPYIRAIEDGVRIIHVGNTLVPTLDDSARPASLSPRVIQDLLRRELGFTGIVIAGPVDARDVIGKYANSSEAAMLALRAGADLIYWERAGRPVLKAVYDIAVAVQKGEIDAGLIDAALKRVVGLKQEQGLLEREAPKEKEAKKLAKLKKQSEESYLVERRSITLVQNRNNVLPLTKERSMPIGITGVIGVEELHDALEDHLKPILQQRITTAKHLGRIQDFEIDRVVRHAGGLRTVVCVFTSNVEPRGQAAIVRELHAKGARIVVILLGYPGILPRLREADAIVLAYSNPSAAAQTLKAVADVLAGEAPVDVSPAPNDLRREVNQEVAFNALDVIRSPMGRLPCTIEAPFIAGFAVPYDPMRALNKVEWDFGDGAGSRDVRAVHAYKEPGRYPVTLRVTDKQGDTVSGTFHVVVENAGPGIEDEAPSK